MQVERLTDAALPLITGFRANILQNPVLVEAIDFAAQTPLLQGFFANVGNFSGDLAPVIRAYTVCDNYSPARALCLPSVGDQISRLPSGTSDAP